MREVRFLKLNSERWKQFEQELNAKSSNPDELADLYIQLTDDLSYARTYYPESKTVNYLNGLTTSVHQKIYKNKREKGSRFGKFWKYELPLAAYIGRKQILYSFLIFVLSVLIGTLSQWKDPGFARVILGDGYVNMTMENIKNGDPMGVYKSGNEAYMFIAIAYNNIKVMTLTFTAGIFLSLFTSWLLFNNGIMLGVFQYFFAERGLFFTSALTIWIHGTLEISAIIISGGAGLMLGNSILFPGTFSRMDSLRRTAIHATKIMLGLLPIIVLAAFLESFVTRHTEMPIFLSLFIILSSLVFIIFYFFIYPQMLIRKNIIHEEGS